MPTETESPPPEGPADAESAALLERLKFPVLALLADRLDDPVKLRTGPKSFGNIYELHSLWSRVVSADDWAGLQIVDSAGRTIEVTDLRDLGHRLPKWLFFLARLASHRTSVTLRERPPMDLDSLKARLKPYVDRPGALWDETEGAAGRARARIERSAALPRLVGICADIFEE
jgi:hypothetical protein